MSLHACCFFTRGKACLPAFIMTLMVWTLHWYTLYRLKSKYFLCICIGFNYYAFIRYVFNIDGKHVNIINLVISIYIYYHAGQLRYASLYWCFLYFMDIVKKKENITYFMKITLCNVIYSICITLQHSWGFTISSFLCIPISLSGK